MTHTTDSSRLLILFKALCSMNNTADLFPKEVRTILSQMRMKVFNNWPNQEFLSLRVVANFLFLRFILKSLNMMACTSEFHKVL